MEKPIILNEQFDQKQLNQELNWLNEPINWAVDGPEEKLVIKTDQEKDFWQKTHYGFQRDDGHFLYLKTDKNFRMTTKMTAHPQNQYDQAGLMVRFSEDYWVKASLEYLGDEPSKLGAVVTNNGYSDWSTQLVDTDEIKLFYRLSKIGQVIYVDFSWDGTDWQQIRVAHLAVPEKEPVMAGIYACSPQGKDQEVHVEFLKIEELSDDPNEAYL